MLFASAFVLSVMLFVLSVKSAYAIIVIVPTVLIPIVNIVVWIIGAIATPVVGLVGLYFKLKNKSLVKGVMVGFITLIIIGLLIIGIFKLIDPNRPIY